MKSFGETSLRADEGDSQDPDLPAADLSFSQISPARFLNMLEERGTLGFWTCDLATGYSSCSPGFLRVAGIEATKPFVIENLFAQVHPEDRLRCDDIWPLIRSGAAVNRSFRIIRGDQTARWVDFRSQVLLDAELRPTQAIGLLQDVSQDNENRQALEESLGRYKALVGAVAAMEWRANATGEPVYSQGWTALTGQRESDVLDGRWLEAIHPDDRDSVAAAWQSAVTSLTPYEANHRIRMANGDYEWFHARAVPVLHRTGRPHGWLGLIIRHPAPLKILREEAAIDATLKPVQIRAGRAMLQWTLEDLSRQSGVSVSSIRRIEAEGAHATRPTSLAAIRQAFEMEGLVFSNGNGIAWRRDEDGQL